MTSPEDDDHEEAVRRALSEDARKVEPSSGGLDKIRARIAGRPPRPWLVSVFSGFVERVRNFTWRGHWARPPWLSRLAEVRWPRLRRGRFPGREITPLRLAAALAAVAVIALITLGVQPLRDAILQTGTALQGGSGPQQTAAGNGVPAIGGKGGAASSGGPGNTGGTTGASSKAGTGKAHPSTTKTAAPTSGSSSPAPVSPALAPITSTEPTPLPTPTWYAPSLSYGWRSPHNAPSRSWPDSRPQNNWPGYGGWR